MTLPPAYFEALYAASGDPWGFAHRWYEQRKRAITVAALPRARYARAYEPGCSTGLLTAMLAPRCDRLLASDVSTVALAAARQRLSGQPGVTFDRLALPEDWPVGELDLVLLSEIGYYFDLPDLARLVTAARASLAAGGHLVAVHWRHPVADYPLGGDEVHAVLAAATGLARTARHLEDDFVLEVFTAVPPRARSVAAEEGLLG